MRVSPSERLSLLRILDANANRAGEGMRVAEEYCRFVLHDRHLASVCKNLRHRLTQALEPLPLAERLAARNTLGDVGTEIETEAEQERSGVCQVAIAALRRTQQALRSLAEYSKPLFPTVAELCEALRYETYTLEKGMMAGGRGDDRLANAQLYVITDGCASPEALEQRVASLVAAGVDLIQLRAKELNDRELLARAEVVRRLTRGTPTLFCVNDRADVALLTDADALHVGQEELTVAAARRVVGPNMLVGVSTHSIEQARQSVMDGASYLGVGPVFPSGTKAFEKHVGLELLREVAAEIALPAFAIGGITAAHVGQVRAAGFSRIAVSGAVCGANDPGEAARELGLLLRGAAR